MNGFSDIAVRMIHGIHKPDTIILRKDIDHRRINIKWHLILKKITKLALFILKDDLRTLVHRLDASSVRRKRIVLLAAVKDNHIRIADHVHKKRLHIRHIDLECACIHTGDMLLHAPAFRFFHFFEFTYQPHAIILNDHPLRLMQDLHCRKSFRCKLFLTVNALHNGIALFQCFLIIFFLTLFAKDQQCFSIDLKVILLQGKAQERGLAAFQKTCDQINGYSGLFHKSIPSDTVRFNVQYLFPFCNNLYLYSALALRQNEHLFYHMLYAIPKSSSSACSSSLEPITHRRPVYSGAPSRISVSSGTISK